MNVLFPAPVTPRTAIITGSSGLLLLLLLALLLNGMLGSM
jgi:hypothetical protein